jgi:hypothetical protein
LHQELRERLDLTAVVEREADMSRLLISFALVLVSTSPCAAIVITLFVDTPTFVERSRDIVIAKCVRPDLDQGPYWDNLHPAEVEVLTVLKGDRTAGKMRIATTYNLEAGKTYLLASGGGLSYGTSFQAIAERSVVKLPAKFRLDDLKGKKLTEQVQAVFVGAGHTDADLLSKTLMCPVPVMQLPPAAAIPLKHLIIQNDKERIARAVQKLQQSKSEKEMREALREVEDAVKAMKATLEKRGRLVAPSTPKKQ